MLGSTLKGKDNFKQLIHGFAEVCLTASATAHLPCHPFPVPLPEVLRLLCLVEFLLQRIG